MLRLICVPVDRRCIIFQETTMVKSLLYTDRKSEAYGSFICMHMTGKHNVNLVLNKPRLKNYSHGFSFHVVVIVAIIPWSVHENDQPRRLAPVHFWQLFFKPLVLRSVYSWKDEARSIKATSKNIPISLIRPVKILTICRIRRQYYDISRSSLYGVPQRAGTVWIPVWDFVPVQIRFKWRIFTLKNTSNPPQRWVRIQLVTMLKGWEHQKQQRCLLFDWGPETFMKNLTISGQ